MDPLRKKNGNGSTKIVQVFIYFFSSRGTYLGVFVLVRLKEGFSFHQVPLSGSWLKTFISSTSILLSNDCNESNSDSAETEIFGSLTKYQ